jgi:hypothetical protein
MTLLDIVKEVDTGHEAALIPTTPATIPNGPAT